MTPFADISDSLLVWASQRELELAEQLSFVDYFPDANIDADELEKITRFYGAFINRQIAAGAHLEELLAITPATAVTTVCGRASRLVDPTHLAEEYLAGLGLTALPATEADSVLREVIPRLCKSLNLVVPSSDLLDILAVHAGLAAAEIPDIIELVESDPGNAVAVLSDSSLPLASRAARLAPEYLQHLLDGVLALQEFSQRHVTSWLDRDRGALEPQLPPVVSELVVAELRERPVGTPDRRHAVGIATREMRPRLILDTTRRRICLRLPEQRVSSGVLPEVDWKVNLGGVRRLLRTGPAWGEPTYAAPLDISVEHQIRRITVTDLTNSIQWTVRVVHGEDPVLIFALNGQDLTDKVALHHSHFWVVAPADSRLFDVISEEELPVLESFDVLGWVGWSARLVDAALANSLQVLQPGQQSSPRNPARSIDPRRRVQFVDPQQAKVPYLRSVSGLEVYSESLSVNFPPTYSGQDETWELSISAYAGRHTSGEEVVEPETVEVLSKGGSVAIFDPEAYEQPWVGEYLVRLRGPRNESFRHRFAIVEGLSATVDMGGLSVRIPAHGGLSPATMHISHGDKPFEVSQSTVTVASDAAGADVLVNTEEGDQLPLRFTPPRMSFELPLVDLPPLWRTTPLTLLPRALDSNGVIRVRGAGGILTPRISIRNRHGSPLFTESLNSEDGGLTWTVPARGLSAGTPGCSMELEWIDQLNNRKVSFTLARIASEPLVSGVSIDAGDLVLEGVAKEQDITLWVWADTAPWIPARELQVTGPRVPLSEDLVNAGCLHLFALSADPFTNFWPPRNPIPGALTADQPGYYAAQSEPLTQLSAFLAGETQTVPTDPSVLSTIWDFGDSRATAVLKAHPWASLQALSQSLVPTKLQSGLFISSGLVVEEFHGATPSTSAHDWLGLLGLLGCLRDAIGSTSEASRGSGDGINVDTAHPVQDFSAQALMREIAQRGGSNLVSTLRTGRDNTLDSACIDRQTVMIAAMTEAQQQSLLEMFFSNAEVVPGHIMDDGSRIIAVFEAFKHREELNALVGKEGLVKPAAKLLRALRATNRALYTSARVRFDKLSGVDTENPVNFWALTPAISMSFALAARIHAHGLLGKSRTLDKALPGWTQLANVVPDLVIGDIIAAEAMVISHLSGGSVIP